MDRFEEHHQERASQNYASTRRWTTDHDRRGLIGEKALAEYFGAEQDLRNKPGGDGGVDLMIWFADRWWAVDAKCSKYGDYLRVDVRKIKPLTIYVLVHDQGGVGKCVGWAVGDTLKEIPPQNWCNNGVWVHALHKDDPRMRPMHELKDRVSAWKHP